MTGLYIHIPFCTRKCLYCDFYSLPGKTGLMDSYVDALLLEAEQHRGMAFETLYIGGGTPSLLKVQQLEKLMVGLRRCFDLTGLQEATIEANPESARPDFLTAAFQSGINRLSIGIQSLNDIELIKAGRIHTAGQAIEAIKCAFKSGFDNISADVILGLPGQTAAGLEYTLHELLSAGLSHLSAYCLSIEEGTPFAAFPPDNLPDGDRQTELYELARAMIKVRGLLHYEISNFALPGRESLHNLNYWRGGEYLGLGPSAASHACGRRLKNEASLEEYIADPMACSFEEDIIGPEARSSEEAMLRLRLLEEGLDFERLADRYGCLNVRRLKSRLDKLSEHKMLVKEGKGYRLPAGAALTSNQVFVHVIA